MSKIPGAPRNYLPRNLWLARLPPGIKDTECATPAVCGRRGPQRALGSSRSLHSEFSLKGEGQSWGGRGTSPPSRGPSGRSQAEGHTGVNQSRFREPPARPPPPQSPPPTPASDPGQAPKSSPRTPPSPHPAPRRPPTGAHSASPEGPGRGGPREGAAGTGRPSHVSAAARSRICVLSRVSKPSRRALLHLCAGSSHCSPSCCFCTAALASSLFLTSTKHVHASAPLHWLCPLAEMLFIGMAVCLIAVRSQ
uniref:Uncharacterized protein n=1 Tax=Rangifer tarandus platyrhynchus TaxID=3082113 RepID=A0ACB0EFP6_RANTA|nr:unnamed protein product [Rangifer tarandus platyrhynchus]